MKDSKQQSNEKPTPTVEQDIAGQLDYESYVPTIGFYAFTWLDMFPIHYICAQLVLVFVGANMFVNDFGSVMVQYIAVTFAVFIYALIQLINSSDKAFERRLVLPNRTSFTVVIVDPILHGKARYWMRLASSLGETYLLLILALYL